eukprot:ctg_807.g424
MTLATVPEIDAELDALEQAVVEACAALVRAAETAHRRGADGVSNAAGHNDLQSAAVSTDGDAALQNRPSHPTNRDTHAADSVTDWDAESWYLPEDFAVPPHCIPVRADVRFAPWDAIVSAAGGNYDAIVMDPPWQLATANPTRGVALGYQQLSDELILSLPIERAGHVRPVGISAGGRAGVGEAHRAPPIGQEPRFLPATRQGDLPGGHQVRQRLAAHRAPRCGDRRDPQRAPRPEPETRRAVRVGGARRAQRQVPGDFCPQEQPAQLLAAARRAPAVAVANGEWRRRQVSPGRPRVDWVRAPGLSSECLSLDGRRDARLRLQTHHLPPTGTLQVSDDPVGIRIAQLQQAMVIPSQRQTMTYRYHRGAGIYQCPVHTLL